MDTLTFNSPIVLRHLTFSEARKMPIDVIDLDAVLKGLELTMDEVSRPFSLLGDVHTVDFTDIRSFKFIDMCMLCGCDYLEPIKGVGAKTALKLIKEHGSMESILEHLKKGKNPPPEDWPYQEARELFRKPDVTPWKEVEVSLLAFLRLGRWRLLLTVLTGASLCGNNLTLKVLLNSSSKIMDSSLSFPFSSAALW